MSQGLLALIDAHGCSCTRTLVTSQHLLRAEIVALPEPGKPRELAAALDPEELAARLQLHDDSDWDTLPAECPAGGLSFGEGDRRWVMCAESASAALDEDAVVATDDEDLIVNMRFCVTEGLTTPMPVASVDLLLSLLECGALHVTDLEAVLEAEDARLRDDGAMQQRKRTVKQERLDSVAARLALLS